MFRKKQKEELPLTPEQLDGEREDPLAVRVGLWVDDIPAEGWPDELKPEVIRRILSYLPTDEVVVETVAE